MKRGEQCRLICKPEYAYGESGSGDKIGPNATLIFDIELFDFIGKIFQIKKKIKSNFCFYYLGDDLSEAKDQSILRRIFKKGEGWAKPSDGSNVEVSIKGIYENQVFDERTVKFIVGEGFLKNIPEGFVVSK
jgi:FK506-binding protein 4/5